jgi:glycosyltransferase 2 family protein
MARGLKSRIWSALIITISLILFYLVLRKIGLGEIVATIGQASPAWLLVSIGLEPLLLLASVKRWQILIESQGFAVSFRRLNALYLVGRFFNNFLPSTVGGDVIRIYELRRDTNDLPTATASVVVDRLTGFIALVGLAVIALLTHWRLIDDVRLKALMAMAVAGLAVLIWLIVDERPLRFVSRSIKIRPLAPFFAKLHAIHSSLNAYRHQRGVLAQALLWSLVFMLLAIGNVYTTAQAFYRPAISFLDIAAIVPILMVVSMMPLTFNGLGIEEWAYVLLFPIFGLPASVGLAAVLLVRAKALLVASIGGVIYPYMKLRAASATVQLDAGERGHSDIAASSTGS